MAARRALLWLMAASLAVIAIASAALLWLRIAGPRADEGGLGIYPPNPRFGPMVHMDTRGEKTRWKG